MRLRPDTGNQGSRIRDPDARHRRHQKLTSQPVAFGQQAPPPSKAEIDNLLAVAPSYGIEIRLPQP
jgi:hypothetical protein